MEWSDQAVILHAERYGEGDAILEVMSREHGRHRGYVKGGMSRRRRADMQPGNEAQITWRARLHSQLGRFTVEPGRARAAGLMTDPAALSAFSAAASTLILAVPEREAHPRIYDGLLAFLDLLATDGVVREDFGAALVSFEVGILGDLGFALDLDSCAATGVSDDLVYVSPRSGRAVSREAGGPYKERLLALPGFLVGSEGADETDVVAGLALSAYFLNRHVLAPGGKELPAARTRFASLFRA